MRFLAAFHPVLVGGVWNGGAGKFSPVRLYLYPQTPEDVIRKLLDTGIPFEEKSHSLTRDAETLAANPRSIFGWTGFASNSSCSPPRGKRTTCTARAACWLVGELRMWRGSCSPKTRRITHR